MYIGRCEELLISNVNSVFLHETGTLIVPELIAGTPTLLVDVPITYPFINEKLVSLPLGVTST